VLGYDPRRVALAREAFGAFRWPIARFERDEVRLIGDLAGTETLGSLLAGGHTVKHPPGWRDSAASVLERR
jgi:hypothetical protein